MITDPVFYRLFESSPETFFLVLGMSADSATDMAARYQYEALEFKETSHRADGVFRPREAGLPVYFLEVQFYYLPSVFADLLVKAYTYLKQHNPGQAYLWRGPVRQPGTGACGAGALPAVAGCRLNPALLPGRDAGTGPCPVGL